MPTLPIGLSTAAWIEPDTERRIASIRKWEILPDFASVNMSEDGHSEAVALVAAVDEELDRLGIGAPRLYHGEGPATWTVIVGAAVRGRDIRIGLEDVLALPGGGPASDNAELVRHALELPRTGQS